MVAVFLLDNNRGKGRMIITEKDTYLFFCCIINYMVELDSDSKLKKVDWRKIQKMVKSITQANSSMALIEEIGKRTLLCIQIILATCFLFLVFSCILPLASGAPTYS